MMNEVQWRLKMGYVFGTLLYDGTKFWIGKLRCLGGLFLKSFHISLLLAKCNANAVVIRFRYVCVGGLGRESETWQSVVTFCNDMSCWIIWFRTWWNRIPICFVSCDHSLFAALDMAAELSILIDFSWYQRIFRAVMSMSKLVDQNGEAK